MDIRRDDLVQVMSGNDTGKRGKVLKVLKNKRRVVVEGVRMMKRHTRPSARDPQGGIIEREAPIDGASSCLVFGHLVVIPPC